MMTCLASCLIMLRVVVVVLRVARPEWFFSVSFQGVEVMRAYCALWGVTQSLHRDPTRKEPRGIADPCSNGLSSLPALCQRLQKT